MSISRPAFNSELDLGKVDEFPITCRVPCSRHAWGGLPDTVRRAHVLVVEMEKTMHVLSLFFTGNLLQVPSSLLDVRAWRLRDI